MEFRDLKTQYLKLKPDIDQAILSACAGASFIGGIQVKELEEQLAEYIGVKYCISCANGTDALCLALMAWGIGCGDAVFVPDFTYFATGEAVASVGAVPLFVDVDAESFNIDTEKLEKAILREIERGKYRIRAVIAVDLFGLPAEYKRLKEICRKYDLYLLEDAAQGFGGSMDGIKSCGFGDISITSFFPAKPLGCYGDGGAVFTNHDDWAELLRSYAVHGMGKSKYDNIRIGRNSRLDTIQAAILKIKLSAFKTYELKAVNEAAEKYKIELKDTVLRLPAVKKGYYSSWAQYTIVLPESIHRESLMEQLKAAGIPSMIYYQTPMHAQKAFEGTDSAEADVEVSESLCKRVLSLPMHPYLSKEDIEYIAGVMKRIDGIC